MAQITEISKYMSEIMNLSHVRHLSYSKRVTERLQEYIVKEMGEEAPAKLLAAIGNFREQVTREDDAFKESTASDNTPQIAEGDAKRDNLLSGIRTLCEAMQRIGTAEQQQAAQRVLKRMNLYKVSGSDSYEDQGMKTNQLCTDLTMIFELIQAVKALNLTDTVSELNTVNEQVRTLINLRNQERALTNTQAVNEARQRTDDAYRWVIRLLDAYAVTTADDSGTSRYDLCIQVMNEDIHYYKTVVNRHSDTAPAPTPPAPDDDKKDDEKKDDEGGQQQPDGQQPDATDGGKN